MYAFYCVRGYSLDDLAQSDFYTKCFLYCAMEQFYEEEQEKYNSILGKG
jgi:hypothetical protein|uniref:Uncharacterized protein n=1 Tax=Siphoviridae sp. ctVqj4 TaxID=2826359 RepID=A0A8S5NLB2_9CAUD|nr:MAG TPA: hypothetical protein [Siphoviridae sp. ctVqj4]